MKTLLFIIALFTMPFLLTEREYYSIQGIVIDSDTHEPISDCHVFISDLSLGTISGSDGTFTLQVPACNRNDMYFISHIGYGTYSERIVSASKKNNRIELENQPILLKGITIRPDKKNSDRDAVLAEATSF